MLRKITPRRLVDVARAAVLLGRARLRGPGWPGMGSRRGWCWVCRVRGARFEAHAWLLCGDLTVTDGNVERYVAFGAT